jgi:transposase
MDKQGDLLEIGDQPERRDRKPVPTLDNVRLRTVNRQQMKMIQIDIEELIGEDHPARAIWDLTGQLDLNRFVEDRTAIGDAPGRPSWPPRLLLSVWLYAYSCGIGSARQIERQCGYHPGFQWLTGMEEINHHTLSDFRVRHGAALEQLFVKLLALLDQEQLIDLEVVTQDGTRIRASASDNTFRRDKTLRQRLQQAQQLVEQLQQQQEGAQWSQRRKAAQQRARRERVERLQEALAEMERVRAGQTRCKKDEVRISDSDPHARIMKGAHAGYLPSYNVQLTTDAKNKVIVAVQVSQSASDAASLPPAMEAVKNNLGRHPGTTLADAGYSTYSNARDLEQRKIAFYAPIPDTQERNAVLRKIAGHCTYGSDRFELGPPSHTLVCPAGQVLPCVGVITRVKGERWEIYQAAASACGGCAQRGPCCGSRKSKRIRLHPGFLALLRLKQRMETPAGQARYRLRSAVAEFPHAWIKTKMNLQQFRLRGLPKVKLEALWHALAYNVAQWTRLSWKPRLELPTG